MADKKVILSDPLTKDRLFPIIPITCVKSEDGSDWTPPSVDLSEYLKTTDADSKYALKDHNHDGVYAPNSHTHEISQVNGLQDEINTLKTSGSDGKSLIASAITAKGVSTASNATFQQMANNINTIKTLINVNGVKRTATLGSGTVTAGDFIKATPIPATINSLSTSAFNDWEFGYDMLALDENTFLLLYEDGNNDQGLRFAVIRFETNGSITIKPFQDGRLTAGGGWNISFVPMQSDSTYYIIGAFVPYEISSRNVDNCLVNIKINKSTLEEVPVTSYLDNIPYDKLYNKVVTAGKDILIATLIDDEDSSNISSSIYRSDGTEALTNISSCTNMHGRDYIVLDDYIIFDKGTKTSSLVKSIVPFNSDKTLIDNNNVTNVTLNGSLSTLDKQIHDINGNTVNRFFRASFSGKTLSVVFSTIREDTKGSVYTVINTKSQSIDVSRVMYDSSFNNEFYNAIMIDNNTIRAFASCITGHDVGTSIYFAITGVVIDYNISAGTLTFKMYKSTDLDITGTTTRNVFYGFGTIAATDDKMIGVFARDHSSDYMSGSVDCKYLDMVTKYTLAKTTSTDNSANGIALENGSANSEIEYMAVN